MQEPRQRRILANQLPPTNVMLAKLLLQATDTSITTASTSSTTTSATTPTTAFGTASTQATTPTTAPGKTSTTTALKWDVGYLFDLTM